MISIGSASTASALSWTDITGPTWRSKDWVRIRTNLDGSVIAVISAGASTSNVGDLYLTRDFGSNWTYTNTSSGVMALAVSGDGNKVIAARDSVIYRASYSGSAWNYPTPRTWSSPTGSGLNQRCAGYGPNFNSLAASSDGSSWIAGVRDESCVYTSTNSGDDWSNTNLGGTNWGSAISADGTIRITSNSNGNLYRNSGSGWSAISTSGLPTSTGWAGIACDSTCTKMAIYSWGGYTWTTSNSGGTWSKGGSAVRYYTDLVMSSDGSVIATTDGSDVYISQDLGATWSSQGLAGKTWVSVTVSGDGKKIYAAANDGTIRKTALLSSQIISFSTPSDMTFGDADQLLTYSASSGLAVSLASNTPLVCSIVANKIHILTAGACSVSANQSGDSTYAPATQVTKTFTISKNSSTIISSGDTSFTYNGLPQGPASSSVTGSTGAITYLYSGSAPTVYSASATKPTNVGSYVVTATVAADSNYLTATSSSYAFSISKAPLTITSSSPTVIYGAIAPSISASFSGLVNNDASSVVSGLTCTTSYTTTSAVGSLPSTSCSGGSASNYTISYVSGTVTINKATPTFSAWSNVSKNFGDSSFPVTAPSVTGSLAGSFSYSSAIASVISISGSSLTVVGSGTSIITSTFTPTDSTNYNSATTTMTVTVGKANLGITASSHTVAYGGAIPTISPSYSGFVNGDTASVISGLTCSTTYTTTTSVGTTTSTCAGASANNYLFNYASGVITVTQGGQTSPLTITSTSVTYGSTLSLTTLGGNGSGSNSFNVDSGPCTVSGSTLTPTAAGTCMVTATKAANGNYLATSSSSTPVTVNPKSLTISGLTGVNKEFDRGLVGAVTGTPTLVGKVGSDDVLLAGTPTFTFASANVATGISVVASGYTLTGTTAGNYTLTQPTVTANITAKAARVVATNTTIAYGATVTSGFTTSGLISPDAVGSASYTYTGTGTATPPTAVGVYTVTPSNAVFSTGQLGNYSITYDTATVTILAKYTITYNANGGVVASSSTTSVDFVVGDAALTLPTATRANYTFTGWYTDQTSGTQVTGAYTPTATATLWARWVQNSLFGMGTNTKVLTITTLAGVGNTYSANAGGGTIAIEYLADALPAGTVIDAYVLSDTSTATSLIGSGNDYVMSLVLAWVATDGTVPTTASGKPISMTVTNSSIKRGAKIYSVIGVNPTLLTTATTDGSAVISITDDPQIIIAITKPDAPTGVSATSGGNASSTISWTAPSDGGSAITSYTATSNAGQTCTSVTTTCAITGLTNGTPYTFTVTATNAIGTSDPSSASSAATPAAPVVTPPSSGGGGGGSTYVAPTPAPTPTVDPAVAAAAAAKALADAKAAEEKSAAEAKALAEKKAAEEAALIATIKALQDKADADSLAVAKKLADELAAAQLKAEEELQAAAALKFAEEQRIAAERAAAAKKITTVYSLTSAFKLNTTYTKRLNTYTKKIATGSTVTCIGYAKSSKTLSYAKAKVVASKQAKALCSSMKKINPTLITKSIVYPASKAPVTTVNKKWIPVSYRVEVGVS